MSDFISVYYYDCVYTITLVYSYRENEDRCRPSLAVGVQNQGIISGERHAEISNWFGELESTFYEHLQSSHPDVLTVSNDPDEGCSGIFMNELCICNRE